MSNARMPRRYSVRSLSFGAVGTLASVSSALALMSACGGGEARISAPQSPNAAPPHTAKAKPARDNAKAADPSHDDDAAPASACADATCFTCGGGFCPSGWYCDEGASGGPACSWLPECSKAGCSCLDKALGRSGCSCKDADGGPHLSCK
jgi:hypothetical protein